jgi:outer membrane protein assembly factor BamB
MVCGGGRVRAASRAETNPTGQDWPCWRGPNGNGTSDLRGIRTDWDGGLVKVWEVGGLDDAGSYSAPVVQGRRLVVTGQLGSDHVVFCLDAGNGQEIWRRARPSAYKNRARYGDGPRATPCIHDGRIYDFERSGKLSCLAIHSGDEIWSADVAKRGGKEPTYGHTSSPTIYRDTVLVQGGGKGLVLAYDKRTGAPVWQSGEGLAGYAAVQRETVGGRDQLVVFHGLGVMGLDPGSGRQLWRARWAGRVWWRYRTDLGTGCSFSASDR